MNIRKSVGFGALFVAVLLLANCKNNKNAVDNTESTETTTAKASPTIPQVTVQQGFVKPKENGRFTFRQINLTDSILTLVVNYSGGCKEHQFDLISGGVYAKSYPPQLTLFLSHVDSGDVCRQQIFDTLSYDVSNVQYPGAKELILRLNNTKETLRYQYN